MSLFKPSELHQFLKSLGIHPKKGLSQNFLIDGNILRKMVAAAELKEGDTVLEIGPGPGVLTQALLDTGAEVIAVEKDETLAHHLQRLQNGKLKVIEDDFCKVDLDHLLEGKRVKVLANIPYHLTGWILQHLLPRTHQVESIHIMIQKEAAERCIAKINTSDYSSFSLFTQYHCTPRILTKVPPSCFYPRPKVDSAILELRLTPPPFDCPVDPLFSVIRTAFQKRRKMLRSSLKSFAPAEEIEKHLETLGIIPTARPQILSLKDFYKLAQLLGVVNSVEGEADPNSQEKDQQVL